MKLSLMPTPCNATIESSKKRVELAYLERKFYQGVLIWKTWFLCEHALDLNAQFDVDEN